MKVGLHFGDSRTRLAASENGDLIHLKRSAFTNIVGFLRLNAFLAKTSKKSEVLCAEQATQFLQQVDLQKPILSGLVNDVRVCRQFVTHLCSTMDPAGTGRIWGVASIPAVAGPLELEKAYRSLKGPLEQVLVVPEPYLVVEGMRLEKCIQRERTGQDLTRGSLVIDIGAATTDICLVRGGFPGPEDQIRLEVAGNSIDDKIFTNALVHTPTIFLSRLMAREIKEEQAFVGGSHSEATQEKSDLLALTDVIRKACDALLTAVVEASLKLLERCTRDVAAGVSRSIVLTGGGSRIRNLPTALEQGLRARGFPEARVFVPDDYKTLVSRGALRFAEKLSDEEWKALATRTPAEIQRLFSGSPDAADAPAASHDLDSLSRMDVGLRSEANPQTESVPAAPPPAEDQSSALSAYRNAGPQRKEREEDPSLVDLEELDLFKVR